MSRFVLLKDGAIVYDSDLVLPDHPTIPPPPTHPPPDPTPSPTPAPAGTLRMEPLRAHEPFRGEPGVIYCFAIPISLNATGLFQLGDSKTPEGLQCRLTIGRYPGDVNYWRDAPFMSPRGQTYYPAKVEGAAKQGLQIRWGLVAGIDVAPISRGQWYLHLEFSEAGEIVYFHAET